MACGLGILHGMGESIQFRPDITRRRLVGEVMEKKGTEKDCVQACEHRSFCKYSDCLFLLCLLRNLHELLILNKFVFLGFQLSIPSSRITTFFLSL